MEQKDHLAEEFPRITSETPVDEGGRVVKDMARDDMPWVDRRFSRSSIISTYKLPSLASSYHVSLVMNVFGGDITLFSG